MSSTPYQHLPPSAFWKTGVTQGNPYSVEKIYEKKFSITKDTRIATAGSCFAQHLSRHLVTNGFTVLDVEPPPLGLHFDQYQNYGYSMYSARYGNIYTMKQLLQLAQEASGLFFPQDYVWHKGEYFIDALRPAIEPYGYRTDAEVASARRYHITRVKELFINMDLLVFTLGLTEMWLHSPSGTVYPTAPGTIGGDYDPKVHHFANADFQSILDDYYQFEQAISLLRGGRAFKVLLTVSPVPLTATAQSRHVLVSTFHSKAILRAIAGQLSADHDHIDYFPSYEIVNNPRLHSSAFSDNLRSVRKEFVEMVMSHFFKEHTPVSNKHKIASADASPARSVLGNTKCEEALLEAFS